MRTTHLQSRGALCWTSRGPQPHSERRPAWSRQRAEGAEEREGRESRRWERSRRDNVEKIERNEGKTPKKYKKVVTKLKSDRAVEEKEEREQLACGEVQVTGSKREEIKRNDTKEKQESSGVNSVRRSKRGKGMRGEPGCG